MELKAHWYQLDESYFYYVRLHHSGWQLSEWSAEGEVQYRHVYPGQIAYYHSIIDTPRGKMVYGRHSSLKDAQKAIEEWFRRKWQKQN